MKSAFAEMEPRIWEKNLQVLEGMHSLTIGELALLIHLRNLKAGWWSNLETGAFKDRNVGELLCLVHSEISEAMEGDRKGLMDDKLPQYPMFAVELADAIIRILDIAAAAGLDIERIIKEKMQFNSQREDHKVEARLAPEGKKY